MPSQSTKKSALRNNILVIIGAFRPACGCEGCQKPITRLSVRTTSPKNNNIQHYQVDVSSITRFYDIHRIYVVQIKIAEVKDLVKQCNEYNNYIEKRYG